MFVATFEPVAAVLHVAKPVPRRNTLMKTALLPQLGQTQWKLGKCSHASASSSSSTLACSIIVRVVVEFALAASNLARGCGCCVDLGCTLDVVAQRSRAISDHFPRLVLLHDSPELAARTRLTPGWR